MQKIAEVFLYLMLMIVGVIAMMVSLVHYHATWVTNDYKPILTAGLGYWLVGFGCLTISFRNGRIRLPLYGIICIFPSILIWFELLRRGPYVFFGN